MQVVMITALYTPREHVSIFSFYQHTTASTLLGTCCGCHWLQLAVVVCSLSHWHKYFTCACGFTQLQLAWCFSFHSLVQILYLHPNNLHCVVVVWYTVVCAYIGGLIGIYIWSVVIFQSHRWKIR